MPVVFPPANCSEMLAMALEVPPPPATYRGTGWALYFLLVVLLGASTAAWVALRDEPRLSKGRSLPLSILSSLALIFSCSSIQLRWALFDDARNASNMPCWLMASSIILGVSIVAVCAVVRSFLFYVNELHSGLIQRLNSLPEANAVSPARASDARASTDAVKQGGPGLLYARHRLFDVFQSIVVSFKRDTWRMIHSKRSEAQVGNSPSQDTNILLRAIAQTSLAKSSRGLLLLSFLMLIPALIIIAVVFAVTPIYWDADCDGCVFYLPLTIGCIMQAVIPAIILLWLLYFVVKFPRDPYGVKIELLCLYLTVPGTYLLALLLILTDPNGISASNTMSYDWLSFIGTLFLVLIWHVQPVLMAYRDRRLRKSVLGRVTPHTTVQSSSFHDIHSAVLQAISDEAFKKLADAMYTSELVGFLTEVLAYEEQYFDRSNEWRVARCKAIVAKYIRSFSPLQVNISAELREQTESMASVAQPPREVFETAKKEATHLLFGVYARFVTASGRRASKNQVMAGAEGLRHM